MLFLTPNQQCQSTEGKTAVTGKEGGISEIDNVCWWCQDLANAGVKKLCVITDKNVVSLPGMKTVLDSLHRSGINFQVYSNVRVEPTDKRFVYFIHCACDLITGSIARSTKRRYLSYSEADFEVFGPAGGRHLEKSKNRHISVTVGPIVTKFYTLTQFDPLDHSVWKIGPQ